MCDDEIIKQAQRGDAIAFSKLLEWVYDIIFRFALTWSGNRLDAEDITQVTCIKLARVLGQFRFESAFTTWLYRLVVNCAHDWRRKESRNYSRDESSEAAYGAQSDGHESHRNVSPVEADAELCKVIAHVETMGKGYKETLLLVFCEGQTHAQAAMILGIKESTISWRIHDIRKRLMALDDNSLGSKESSNDR